MKKIIIALLVAVFLFGCSNPGGGGGSGGGGSGGKLPGKFSVTVLSDAMGGSARGVSLGTYTVANSKSIFFILRNVGDFPITDITLTPGKLNKDGGAFVAITDNAVTASPGAITVLETSGKASVETVIEVDINHGNVVGLISQQYIQKADFKGTTVRISGKTKDGEGKDTTVSIDLDIETFIKVASFEVVYSLDNGVTYKKAEASESTYYEYIIPTAGKNYIKIQNTGNTPLKYKVASNTASDAWENSVNWVTVEANNYSSTLLGDSMKLVIDTIGIAFDNGGIEYNVFRPGTSIVINTFDVNANCIILAVLDN